MAIVRTDDKHYKAIADTLREYGQGNTKFTPDEMPQGIIHNCLGHFSAGKTEGYNYGYIDGYDSGETDGYTDGFSDGYNDGYTFGETNGKDLGNQEAYDAFWDSFQDMGKRTVYDYCFWRWNNTTFKPKYPIIPVGTANSIFREISGIDDLGEWFRKLGITVDLSKVTSCNDSFYGFKGTRIGEINVTNSGYYNFMFSSCTNLETIDKLILKNSGTPTYSNMFLNCHNLKNIVVEGTFRNDVSFAQSTLLTHDSLIGKEATDEQIYAGKNLLEINGVTYYGGIINALMTNTSGTKTLTLGTDNLDKLSDAEKAIATERGWTLA